MTYAHSFLLHASAQVEKGDIFEPVCHSKSKYIINCMLRNMKKQQGFFQPCSCLRAKKSLQFYFHIRKQVLVSSSSLFEYLLNINFRTKSSKYVTFFCFPYFSLSCCIRQNQRYMCYLSDPANM